MREENGCLFFSPSRHREGLIALDDRGCITSEVAASMEWEPVPTEPGDVLFFSSYAPHKSPPNGTDQSRRAIYLTYNALSEGDFRQQYYDDKRKAFAEYKIERFGQNSTNKQNWTFPRKDGDAMTTHVLDQSLAQQMQDGSKGEKVDALFAYIEKKGGTNYDDQVTQLEHALQTAALAKASGGKSAQVTSALLHDLGHLLVSEHNAENDFLEEDLEHEVVGAKYLEAFFPPEVTVPIGLHVPSKRYLCTVDADYYDALSTASKQSFEVQGGKMSDAERVEFEKTPHLEFAVQLRRWDDGGKVAGLEVAGLEAYREDVPDFLTLKLGQTRLSCAVCQQKSRLTGFSNSRPYLIEGPTSPRAEFGFIVDATVFDHFIQRCAQKPRLNVYRESPEYRRGRPTLMFGRFSRLRNAATSFSKRSSDSSSRLRISRLTVFSFKPGSSATAASDTTSNVTACSKNPRVHSMFDRLSQRQLDRRGLRVQKTYLFLVFAKYQREAFRIGNHHSMRLEADSEEMTDMKVQHANCGKGGTKRRSNEFIPLGKTNQASR